MMFRRFAAIAALGVAVLAAGCAATVNTAGGPQQSALGIPAAAARSMVFVVTGEDKAAKSADWETLKGEWRTAMRAAADAAGMTVKFADAVPAPTADDGTVVAVRVADYRYISPGARFGFGVLTGNAYMDANVQFLDQRSGRPYGERRYNTTSSAWQGVFSAMTEKQLAAIATEITNEIKRR